MKKRPVDRLLTIQEVAERLSVDPRTIDRWRLEGELRSYKLGRSRRISEEDLMNFLSRHRE